MKKLKPPDAETIAESRDLFHDSMEYVRENLASTYEAQGMKLPDVPLTDEAILEFCVTFAASALGFRFSVAKYGKVFAHATAATPGLQNLIHVAIAKDRIDP